MNEGAAVRVSLVAFGAEQAERRLNGLVVTRIHSDLTAGSDTSVDLTHAKRLSTNAGVGFQGPVLVGPFDVEPEVGRSWLLEPNPNGRPNSDVLRPLTNGKDITARPRGFWVVDFDARSQLDASLFELPFGYVEKAVKPEREKNRDQSRKARWWLHGRMGTDWRASV